MAQASSGATSVGADERPMVFWCKIDNVRVVNTILSTIHAKPGGKESDAQAQQQQLATVSVKRTGVTFTVEEARVFRANAFLAPELFQEFHFADAQQQQQQQQQGSSQQQQQVSFRINLNVLMECLGIFSTSTAYTAMQIGYEGYGQPLVLMLEEGALHTECRIRTLEPADDAAAAHAAADFHAHELVADAIIEAELLKDAFAALDWSSATARLFVSPDAPFFRLSTEGAPGSLTVTYPQADVFERFQCARTQVSRYSLSALRPTVRALALAHKTRLCTNAAGVLSLQHMVQTEDRKTSFVEFIILPDADDDDEDEDEDGGVSAAAAALGMGGSGR